MKKKLWVRLFLQIALVFAVFVAVLCIADSAFLTDYYISREKKQMQQLAEKIDEVELYGGDAGTKLSELISNKSYSLKITDSFGNSLFTTYDAPVADYKGDHQPNALPDDSDGRKGFFTATVGESEYLRYRCTLSGGENLQLGVQLALLKNSADTANSFILIVASVCLVLTLIWVLLLSRKTAKPIVEINEITNAMARLDFSRKLTVDGQDEIARLAAAINELSGTLDTTLKDLNGKNEKLRGEIEAERKLDKMRKGFVANVSHELKTPLAIIRGYAEGLKLGLDADGQKEYSEVIIDEAARMNEMIVSLLDLSRLESGQITINPEKYDIAEQLREFVSRMSGEFKKKNATVTVELPEALPVFADSARIAQVISNYLSNAASHLSDGGRVRIFSTADEKSVKISVYNTGERIRKEDMQHLWESFWRGEQSHKREKDRFGIGLSIVRAVMERHNEACGVYNTADGVVFWFSLPLAE